MTSSPEVSVAVATRNRSALLRDLLDSLRAQTLPAERFEVVVADDGCTDDTPELLERERERGDLALTVVRLAGDGPAAARNRAWRAARAPLIAFTDDDCVVTPAWLDAALDAAQKNPGAFVQGPTRPKPEEAHRLSPFSRTQVIEGPGPLYETCNIVYPRKLLERLDGFADNVYALPAGEDTDLAWRALEQGIPAAYAPDALVHHAVLQDGPLGMLRHAWRWHAAIPVFARHPGLRREHLRRGVFWSKRHEQLLLFAAGLALRKRSRVAAAILCGPYLLRLVGRRSGPLLAPYLLLHDLVEMAAVVRGGIRSRVLVV